MFQQKLLQAYRYLLRPEPTQVCCRTCVFGYSFHRLLPRMGQRATRPRLRQSIAQNRIILEPRGGPGHLDEGEAVGGIPRTLLVIVVCPVGRFGYLSLVWGAAHSVQGGGQGRRPGCGRASGSGRASCACPTLPRRSRSQGETRQSVRMSFQP